MGVRGRRKMTWEEKEGGWMGEEEERARGTVCLGTGWSAGEEEAAIVAALRAAAAAAATAAASETSTSYTRAPLAKRPQFPGHDGATKPGERGNRGALAGGRPGTA